MAKICNETRLLLELTEQALEEYIKEAEDTSLRYYLRYVCGIGRYQTTPDSIEEDLENA